MNIRKFTGRSLWLHVVILLAVIVGVTLIESIIADALPNSALSAVENRAPPTSLSPNPGLLYDNNGNTWGGSMFASGSPVSSGHGFKHLLKNEVSSNVRIIQLHVYYPSLAAAQGDQIALKNDYCSFSATNGNPGASPAVPPDGNNSNPFIGNRHVADFTTNGVAVTGFRNAATPNGMATTCANFNATWPIAGTPVLDPATEMYVNSLVFSLEGNRYAAGAQKVLFQVASRAGGVISLDANTGKTNFGIVEEEGVQSSNLGMVAGIPFGMSCSDPATISTDKPITVYDPDPGGFGNSFMFIEKRAEPTPSNRNPPWQKLSKAEYGPVSGINSWDGSANRWVISGIPTGADSTVSIAQFRKDTDYMLVFDSPYYAGKNQPSANVISVNAPGESISIQVSCQYDMVPSASVTPPQILAGQALSVSGSVANNGPVGGIAGSHTWDMIFAKYSDKPTPFGGTVSSAFNQCTVIPAGASACSPYISPQTYPAVSSIGPQAFGTDPNDPPGTYYCFVTRVYNPTHDPSDDTSWRYSGMSCSVVIKKPRTQFLGSDVHVNGKSDSSYFNPNGTNYGSWAEYGVFIASGNNLLSSGNSLRNGNPGSPSTWNNLTFANTPSYGNYAPVPNQSSTQTSTYFSGLQPAGGTLNQAAPASGVYDVAPGSVIGPMNVTNNGTSVIIRSSGTVVIGGNITVSNNGVTSAGNLSQVVIVANDIQISPNVSQIDAWLVTPTTGGYIDTCTGPSSLTSTICNIQLNVNGPIYTSSLRLRRTAGAEPRSGGYDAPAERFSLRPDAQLWSYAYFNKADFAQTDIIEELPPRY